MLAHHTNKISDASFSQIPMVLVTFGYIAATVAVTFGWLKNVIQ